MGILDSVSERSAQHREFLCRRCFFDTAAQPFPPILAARLWRDRINCQIAPPRQQMFDRIANARGIGELRCMLGTVNR